MRKIRGIVAAVASRIGSINNGGANANENFIWK